MKCVYKKAELMGRVFFIIAKFLIFTFNPLWKPFIGFWLKYRYGITRKSKKRKTE